MKLVVYFLLSVFFGNTYSQIILQTEQDGGYPIPGDLHAAGVQNLGVTPFDDKTLAWRLPRDVIPTDYDLTITPVLDDEAPEIGEQFEAPGEVTITVKVQTATKEIILHSVNITIHDFSVTEESTGHGVPVDGNFTDLLEHDFHKLTMMDDLEANKTYQIHFTFTSLVKNGLDGLYRSSYIDPSTNTTKWIATTQMEALHARQMFPCFDEPALKAVFHITIGRRKEHIALATTQSIRNRTMVGRAGWMWEEFAPTVVMPTYLLAIIVSEFTFTEAPSSDEFYQKPVRTYAPKHYIDRSGGIYAAEKASRMLKYFEEYYVEKYPIAKMDSAAVPSFFFGAMENYGLNIYRETALLYFPDESTEAERFSITRILAHELGHQWFGNLVSPRWWTHIWLNEGFATYLGSQGVTPEGIGHEFEPWERFQNDAVQNSMAFDARSDYSHSVKIDEGSWITRDAMSWFDRMAYEKSGSLIRMMNGFLTEPVMQRALRTYLKDMSFNAAVQDDLFDRLNVEAVANSKIPSGLTVKDIMDTWTLQPGFPLIRVSVAGADGIFISQERFINNEVLASDHINQDTGLWFVPMSIARRSIPTEMEWMYNNVSMKWLPANTAEWIVVNAGAEGFYRVLYDAQLTQLIKNELELNHNFISAVTRSQLLDDYFNAAWQKYSNIETALSLAEYLGKEQAIVVWNSVLNNLRKPFNLLSSTGSFYNSLRAFLLPRLQNATSLTGGVAANLPEKYGGMCVIRHLQFMDWLCGFEDPECIAFSLVLVNQWRSQPTNNAIRRDIKPVAYCAAVANGNDDIFNFIYGMYKDSSISVKQRGTLLNSLACTKDISRINTLLEGTLQDGYYLENAHAATLMQQFAKNALARDPMLRFLRRGTNTNDIIARLGLGAITNTLVAFENYVSSATELADINAYLAACPALSIPRVQAALVTIQQNIQWVIEFATPMTSYFKTL